MEGIFIEVPHQSRAEAWAFPDKEALFSVLEAGVSDEFWYCAYTREEWIAQKSEDVEDEGEEWASVYYNPAIKLFDAGAERVVETSNYSHDSYEIFEESKGISRLDALIEDFVHDLHSYEMFTNKDEFIKWFNSDKGGHQSIEQRTEAEKAAIRLGWLEPEEKPKDGPCKLETAQYVLHQVVHYESPWGDKNERDNSVQYALDLINELVEEKEEA